MNTKTEGEVSEAKVLSRLVEAEVDVFLPFSENTRVDMVVSIDSLQRVQVKTGWLKEEGVVEFNTSSQRSNRSEIRGSFDYNGDIDAFICYCPDNDGFYWVDIDDSPDRSMKIRVEEPEQSFEWINWAEDYKLQRKL